MFAPDLARSGQADALVLLLPGRLIGGTAGDLLSALVVAGAFAAFLSTTSGLVVSLAGVISQDVLGGSVRGFPAGGGPLGRRTAGDRRMTQSLALAGSVGLVFAFTASTICPVLLLGIWWRGLTDVGAIAGMVTGGRAVRRGDDRRTGARRGGGAAVAGPAGRVDRARRIRRDRPGFPGHEKPGAPVADAADDPAAHTGKAAGNRTVNPSVKPKSAVQRPCKGQSMAAISSTTRSRKASTWLSS